jgi:hypothetical protein
MAVTAAMSVARLQPSASGAGAAARSAVADATMLSSSAEICDFTLDVARASGEPELSPPHPPPAPASASTMPAASDI